MSKTQHLQEHLQSRPDEERPATDGWPVLARVEIETRGLPRLHSPLRQKAVAQVLDFYPEIIRRTANNLGLK
jgi:hypothetical protein